MKSMTGYARGTAEKDGNSVTLEISSVNSRKQIDMRFTIPRELGIMETELMNIASKSLSRGSFKVAVTYQLGAESISQTSIIDRDMAIAAAAQMREIGKAAGISSVDLSWHDLLLIPGVAKVCDSHPYESLRKMIIELFESTLKDLNTWREEEGKRLRQDLLARGETIRALVEHIESRKDEANALLKTKLQERIANLGLELPIDDEKLSREVIFYIEKADITEETVRLKSHLVKYAELLNSNGDPGRDLDFLGQEMNREANTLAAKTADMTIAEDALKLKTELSRIREQIMNVE